MSTLLTSLFHAPRTRRGRNIRAILLGILLGSILLGTYAIWSSAVPRWELSLDTSGPAARTCQMTTPDCQSFPYTWTITSYRILSQADGSIVTPRSPAKGDRICAYRIQSTWQPVTPLTSSATIDHAPSLAPVDPNGACRTDQPYSFYVFPPYQIHLLFLMVAFLYGSCLLVYLHATDRQRVLPTITGIFILATDVIYYPVGLVVGSWLTMLDTLCYSSILWPIIAISTWQTLVHPHRPRQRLYLRIFYVATIAIGAGIGTLLILCMITNSLTLISLYGGFNISYLLAMMLATLTGIFVGNIIKQTNTHQRELARFIGGSIIVGLLPTTLLVIAPLIFHLNSLIDLFYSILCLMVIPFAIVYAILKRRYFKSDSRLRSSVHFFNQAIGVVVVASLVSMIVGTIIHMPYDTMVHTFVLLAGILALTPPFSMLIRKFTEQLFFPEVIEYERILFKIQTSSLQESTLQDTASLLTPMIEQFLTNSPVGLYVRDNLVHQFNYISPLRNLAESSIPFEANHLLIRYFEGSQEHRRPLRFPDYERYRGSEDDKLQYDPANTWDLFVPVYSNEELIAFLALGERDDGFAYQDADLDWLSRIAHSIARTIDYGRIVYHLERMNARQRELDTMKDQFIMTVHHELRTPVTSIIGYLDLIQSMSTDERRDAPEELNRYVTAAASAAERLVETINIMLKGDQAQLDREHIRLQVINLYQEIAPVVDDVQTAYNSRNQDLRFECDQNIKVTADPTALRRVITNLVTNAVKYSPPNAPIRVMVLDAPQDQIEILVRDWGKGIPPEKHFAIFERFVRLDRDLNSGERGNGLGLFVARNLVEAMNGTIAVESSGIPGEGTTFRVVLPGSPATLPAHSGGMPGTRRS